MRTIVTALAALAFLAACSDSSGPMGAATEEAAVSSDAAGFAGAPPAAPVERAPDGEQAQAQPGQSGPVSPQAPISYLAYAYTIGLELPGDRLIGVMEGHAAACRQAGPRLCQLIGAERSGDPDAYIRGSLSIRGEPGWLQQFMGGLEREARSAGGRIRSQSTTTEDLTRAIVDTEASLRAKRALRDRLQQLLQNRPSRLSDLLEVERELARVQAEIDATESSLAVMRTRVSMSALTLSYESQARPVAADTFEPLGQALANFVGLIVQGVAAIITLIAVLIPWALLLAAVVWFALWLRKRRGGRLLPRRERNDPPPPPAAAAG